MSDSARQTGGTKMTPSRIWMCAWLAATVIFAVLLINQSMAIGAPDLNLAMNFIFLAVIVLSMRFWTGALVFAFCQAELLFGDLRTTEPVLYPDGWLLTGLCFCLILVLSAYRTLQDRDLTAAHRLLLGWLREQTSANDAMNTPQASATTESPNPAQETGRLLRQLFRSALLLGACAFAAWIVLGLFPTNRTFLGLNTIIEYRLRPAGHRTIVMGLTLFTLFFVAYTLVNEMMWQRLSRRQSRIYVNSILLKTLLPDFRMMVRKRLKARRSRYRRARKAAARPTEYPPEN